MHGSANQLPVSVTTDGCSIQKRGFTTQLKWRYAIGLSPADTLYIVYGAGLSRKVHPVMTSAMASASLTVLI